MHWRYNSGLYRTRARGPAVRLGTGTQPSSSTYIDGLLAVVLDADPRLLDDVQVGAGDGQGRVPAAENRETGG